MALALGSWLLVVVVHVEAAYDLLCEQVTVDPGPCLGTSPSWTISVATPGDPALECIEYQASLV